MAIAHFSYYRSPISEYRFNLMSLRLSNIQIITRVLCWSTTFLFVLGIYLFQIHLGETVWTLLSTSVMSNPLWRLVIYKSEVDIAILVLVISIHINSICFCYVYSLELLIEVSHRLPIMVQALFVRTLLLYYFILRNNFSTDN